MSVQITIPISTFELTVSYDKPNVKIMADRGAPLQALLDALGPWQPDLDEMEIITAGKLTEQGIKIRIASQKSTFFFGLTYCKYVRDAANWSEADEILRFLQTVLTALAQAGGMTFGKRLSILSLHLQLKTVPFKDVIRPLISSDLLKLDSAPSDAMATVIRWPKHRITLDGSAAIANGIFVQMEREFDASVSFDEIKGIIYEDEVKLFKLLRIEEVEA